MPKSTVNEAVQGFTHYFRFDYADLQRSGFLSTIGAANQKIIGNLEPGDLIDMVAFYQITDPAGASDLTLDVGTTSSDPDEFINALDVDGLTKVAVNTGESFVGTDSGTDTTSNVINCVANDSASDAPIYMEFNGTLSSLTQGEWVIAWRQASLRGFAGENVS